jgi:glycosyltransferase involved in cell wall biosynthesis
VDFVISFIVPAHNEQACLGRTLEAIHQAGRAIGELYEIIVVDDASTDETAGIARRQNACVVSVNHRQIAAARNSGGRAARGERLFFVDADTIVNSRAVASALRAMDKGAVGGGGPTWVDRNEKVPLYIRMLALFAVVLPRVIGFSGGAFMFCTREAFQATGGFNERFYWGEEGLFALALKREGRFVGLSERVLTSGRRFRRISGLQMIGGLVRMAFSPIKSFTHRSFGEKVWYDSNRADDDKMPNSLAAQVSNGLILVILVVALTEPIWTRLPWSFTPLDGLFGKTRIMVNALICHLGLLLFWPVAAILLVNLLRQKRWTGLMQSGALISFCLWNAWGATRVVVQFWPWLLGA